MGGSIRQTAFGEVDIDALADIQDVRIDATQPRDERVRSYIRQIRNPHLYRYGEVIVRASYADCGATLADRLREYFLSSMNRKLV